MIVAARGMERGRILSWPRPFAANPYLGHLAEALANEGVTTIADRYLATLAVAPRRARWLHVHWPEWMITDRSLSRARARAWWLWRLLDRAQASGIRLAWTAHNLVAHDDPHPDFGRACRRELLARCAVVFGHFPSAETEVRALGFRGRFVCTPHPGYSDEAATMPTRSEARASLGYASHETVLLAFGAVEPYKGFVELAEAFVRAPREGVRLHVAGEPRSRQVLERLGAIAANEPAIRLEMRHVDAPQVSRLFAAADATLVPYRAFFTSGTAMLSLSHGTPVAGPPRHHLAAFAGEPFFVPMESPSALDSTVERVRALPVSVREAARRYADERTWARTAKAIAGALFEGGTA